MLQLVSIVHAAIVFALLRGWRLHESHCYRHNISGSKHWQTMATCIAVDFKLTGTTLVVHIPLTAAECILLCYQVYHVRNKMDSVGLDMLLDVHGDEELPYNFINGNEVCSAPTISLFELFSRLSSAVLTVLTVCHKVYL